MNKLYTFSRLGTYGALGNQMWQIAGVLGEARKSFAKGEDVAISFPEWGYAQYFNVNQNLFVQRELKEGTEVVDFYPDYMQDLGHFDHCSDLIRDQFLPSEYSAKVIDTMFDDFARSIIAVHVRRANNLSLPDHHPVLPLEYFEAALDKLDTSRADILVFSDDIEWCKKQDLFKDAHFGLGIPEYITDVWQLTGDKPLTTENAAIDLLAMANCHYHIISNSTFSWWGAWLAKSHKVIFPSRWYGPALKDVNFRAMIPYDWTEVLIKESWNTTS